MLEMATAPGGRDGETEGGGRQRRSVKMQGKQKQSNKRESCCCNLD